MPYFENNEITPGEFRELLYIGSNIDSSENKDKWKLNEEENDYDTTNSKGWFSTFLKNHLLDTVATFIPINTPSDTQFNLLSFRSDDKNFNFKISVKEKPKINDIVKKISDGNNEINCFEYPYKTVKINPKFQFEFSEWSILRLDTGEIIASHDLKDGWSFEILAFEKYRIKVPTNSGLEKKYIGIYFHEFGINKAVFFQIDNDEQKSKIPINTPKQIVQTQGNIVKARPIPKTISAPLGTQQLELSDCNPPIPQPIIDRSGLNSIFVHGISDFPDCADYLSFEIKELPNGLWVEKKTNILPNESFYLSDIPQGKTYRCRFVGHKA